MLLRHGANFAALDNDRRNVVWAATVRKHTSVALAVIDHVSTVSLLANQKDARGVSPLFLACERSLDRVVSAILSRTTDLSAMEAATNSGHTPLFAASYSGSDSSVRLLVACGANVLREGPTLPLYIACERGHDRVVGALLEKPHPVSQIVQAIKMAKARGNATVCTMLTPIVPPILLV